MDKNIKIYEKSITGFNSSRIIRGSFQNGSQTSRSQYNTSICEQERVSVHDPKKIMDDFLEQSHNRKSTFQFLDSRNKLSQNIIRTTQDQSSRKTIRISANKIQRKWDSQIPFERQGTINSNENKREIIKDAEKQFLISINSLNKQEIFIKMESFILSILQEDFKELASLFQLFTKELYENHQQSYKQLKSQFKQQELYIQREAEENEKKLKVEKNNLIKIIEDMKIIQLDQQKQSTLLINEQIQVIQSNKNQIVELQKKQKESDVKLKKLRNLEIDNQALHLKNQFYENKLSKQINLEEKLQQQGQLNNEFNLKFLDQLQRASRRTLSSQNDSYSLNNIQFHKEQIIEVRSISTEIESDFISQINSNKEQQSDLILLDQKYDDVTLESLEFAIQFVNYNQQNFKDELQQDIQKMLDSQINFDFLSKNSQQNLKSQQSSKQLNNQAQRNGIIGRHSLKPQNQIDIQQKQIIQFINFQKYRIASLNSEIDELNVQLQDTYNNLDIQNKKTLLLEKENLDLKLKISELSETYYELKQLCSNQNITSTKLIEIKCQKTTNKQETENIKFKVPTLGQRITISYDFQKNQSNQLVQKVKQKKFGKIRNLIPQKVLLKYISTFYQEKLHSQKDNKLLKDQDIGSFIYNYYLKQFGYTKLTEQKFIILLLSVQKNISIVRINVFAKFLGLLEDNFNFSLEEQKKYLEALDLVNALTHYGVTIKNNESNCQQYVPYIRALSYLESLYYFKSQDKYTKLKQELDLIKEIDPSGQNRDGVLDFDQMMLKVLLLFRENVKNIQTFVINAFNASDLDGNGMCNLEEWLILNKYIEKSKYDQQKLTDKFMESADLLFEGEKYLSFDRFSVVCLELDIFSDNSQNSFLNIQNNEEILQKFGLLRESWQFEYQNQIDQISQSQMPQNLKEKWLEIIGVIDDHIVSNPEQKKPILIAWNIYLLETDQYINKVEEIQE